MMIRHLWLLFSMMLFSGAAQITADDFLVEGLDEIDPVFAKFDGQMHAGLISIDKDINAEKGKLMFWLFEPDHPAVDDSFLIWFNGGPGCSSFHAGLFLEMGPITTPLQPAGSYGQKDHEPRLFNRYSWTNVTAVMYVEQPVGTGFSYGAEAPEDEEGVSRDFYNFIQNFITIFPDMARKRLFLVGESYAGYYVPSIAHFIATQNKIKSNKPINLHGIALGNGWADVENQGPAVIDYAYWHGMIDSVTRDVFHAEWEHCKLRTGKEPAPFHALTTPDECGIMENVLAAAGAGLFEGMSPNTYDVTTWDKYLLLSSPSNTNVDFLNNPRVQEKLHVPKNIGKRWYGCIPGAGRRRRKLKRKNNNDLLPGQLLLMNDKPISMAPYIADLLDDAKINVLIYNGDRDLSTCSQGSEKMLDGVEWSGAAIWKNPQQYRRAIWMVENYPAGYAKAVKNLEFVIVYNSGHLVPYNVPIQAQDLVKRLVTNKTFADVDIPVVFSKSTLDQFLTKKSQSKISSSGAFLPAIFGFFAGACCVFMYMKLYTKRIGRSSVEYEEIGEVEVEPQGIS